ncbi:MAG: KEOPS complex subunit Pcc1 [Candidatus Micrarchaeales archaeon]
MEHKALIIIPKKVKLEYKKALAGTREHKRSGMQIEETAKELRITIKTSDLTALRATINSIMRDIQVIEGAGSI